MLEDDNELELHLQMELEKLLLGDVDMLTDLLVEEEKELLNDDIEEDIDEGIIE